MGMNQMNMRMNQGNMGMNQGNMGMNHGNMGMNQGVLNIGMNQENMNMGMNQGNMNNMGGMSQMNMNMQESGQQGGYYGRMRGIQRFPRGSGRPMTSRLAGGKGMSPRKGAGRGNIKERLGFKSNIIV